VAADDVTVAVRISFSPVVGVVLAALNVVVVAVRVAVALTVIETALEVLPA
jgi:hypothetical protein